MKTKKIFYFSIAALCSCNILNAQFYSLPSDTNFNAIRASFYQNYTDTIDTVESSGFNAFRKWENFWAPRLYPSGSFQKHVDAVKLYVDNYDVSSRTSSVVTADWTEIGPKQNGLQGIGRLLCIAFDPNDADIMYVGSWVGGVWKTEDGGQSWNNLNTDQQFARLGV